MLLFLVDIFFAALNYVPCSEDTYDFLDIYNEKEPKRPKGSIEIYKDNTSTGKKSNVKLKQ